MVCMAVVACGKCNELVEGCFSLREVLASMAGFACESTER